MGIREKLRPSQAQGKQKCSVAERWKNVSALQRCFRKGQGTAHEVSMGTGEESKRAGGITSTRRRAARPQCGHLGSSGSSAARLMTCDPRTLHFGPVLTLALHFVYTLKTSFRSIKTGLLTLLHFVPPCSGQRRFQGRSAAVPGGSKRTNSGRWPVLTTAWPCLEHLLRPRTGAPRRSAAVPGGSKWTNPDRWLVLTTA
jgi:hypothetical protein